MSEWKVNRFWTKASVVEAGQGYAVHLDGRPVKTPAKAPLEVPTRPLAEAIAGEWNAQNGKVDPAGMPYTRSANAAIDKVTHQHGEVAEMIAEYGDSDLTCYRAKGPEDLIARQTEAWDPLLDWAAKVLGARLVPVQGVVHRPQDAAALERLAVQVRAMDAFALTAFHDLVGLSGSLIIGFAAIHGFDSPTHLWRLSRVDEGWQEEQWGIDEEAAATAARKESEFFHAKSFYDISR